MITEWWTTLDLFAKILWIVALSSSLVFLIESILTFVGLGGGEVDFDLDVDMETGSGSNPYTFRNFVNFCLGFSWTAILMRPKISQTWLLILLSVIVGVALVAIVMYLFKWLSSMQQSGNIDIQKSSAGCQGTVYLAIPGARQGMGKVQISINNAIREYDAMTDGDPIPTGRTIRVVEAIDGNTVLVEELKSLII